MWGKKQTFTQCVSNDGRRTQMQTQERENQNKTQSWLNSFSTTDHTATQHIFFYPRKASGFRNLPAPPAWGHPALPAQVATLTVLPSSIQRTFSQNLTDGVKV